MATVHVTFRNAISLGGYGVSSKTPRKAQTITSSAASQQTTITAMVNEIATISVTGGNIFIAVGQNPTAASGAGDLVIDGTRLELGALASGDKIALINA